MFSNQRQTAKAKAHSATGFLFPQYQEPEVSGSYEVATVSYTYTDVNRLDPYSDNGQHRLVNVEFWYPTNADASCPLILFSHGSYGIRSSNVSTYRNLASNGYIVCSLDHPHHSFFTQALDGTITLVNPEFIQLTTDVNNGVYDDKTQIKLMRDVTMIRVEDLSFVLDTLLSYSEDDNSDDLYHRIDFTKIGVFGHSLGGAATMELGRIRDDIGAVINLDGDMLCEYKDYEDNHLIIEETPYPCPLLNIWSDTMIDLMEKDLALFSPIMSKIILSTVSVDTPTTGSAKDTIEDMNELILEFFDCYLRQGAQFQAPSEYHYPDAY